MCQICDHPQREAIDRAIVARDSLRKIGTMFGTSKSEVDRHKRICMARTLPALAAPIPAPAYQSPGEAVIVQQNVRSVAFRAGQLVDKMEQLAERFEATGDTNGILRAAKEIREGLRLLAQLSGELSPSTTAIQINNNAPSLRDAPEWSIFIRIVERHPQVKAELVAALQESGL